MTEDVEVSQEKPSSTCCAALKKKHSKLLEKYAKLEELKNKFRDCTALVQQKYDVIEKENENLKKALEELKVQANVWKDEKEKEYGIRVDLEDEVSALKDEVQLLGQKDNPPAQEANEQLQARLNVAEKEIKQLRELLDKERGKAAQEKKNAELKKKKADEALKKVGVGKNKVSELQKVADVERKRAEENKLLWEKLKMEFDAVKLTLASERSKSEAADKKVVAEKQKVITERKRADLAVAKAEEQRLLAETNLKKAMFEKDRADDLNRNLEETRNRAEKLEEELCEHLCSGKLVEAQANEPNTGMNAELAGGVCIGMLKNDAQLSRWIEKMLLEKEHNIIKEKKRADSERKKAKKHRKIAEAHKTMAMEQKHRADQLSRELESYNLKFEELQKELQGFVSHRIDADNAPGRHSNTISETDIVKMLKKRLELEKILVKHAEKASKVEAVRNNMLHQELVHLKHEFLQFQQRLEMLDESFLHGYKSINHLEKELPGYLMDEIVIEVNIDMDEHCGDEFFALTIGNQTSTRETLCSDGFHRRSISGIHSRLDPPCRGSSTKMLQSSAINSSSASFSDRPLVGSQERGTFSVTTSAKLGEDVSNPKPTISRPCEKIRMRCNERTVAKAGNNMRSPIKYNVNRIAGYRERKRVLDAVESIENLYSKGEKLHQQVSEKLSLLHGILDCQKDERGAGNPKENSCRKLVRPFKRRKTSREGTVVIHCLKDSGKPQSTLDSDVDQSDACMHTSPPGFDVMKFDQHFKDGENNNLGCNQCIPQDFDEMATYDYMKLLDLDNAADENSYRRAIDMPLSPMLPVVEFHGDEELEVDNHEMLVDKSSKERLSNVQVVSTSSFHTIDVEKNPTSFAVNGLVSSECQANKGSVDFLKNMDSVLATDTCFHQIHVSGEKMGTSDLSVTENGLTNTVCEKGSASGPGDLLKYFVVSSDNKDNCSILRILQTIGCCMRQCSSLHSVEIFLQSILHTLLKAEDLSMKEKVCVFFSLTLHEISEVGMKNPTNVLSDDLVQSLNSVTSHICSALSNPVLRRIFVESCHLFELLAVIEDFLLHRKVLVCSDVSAKSEALCSSKIDLVLNGNAMVLSEVMASPHLLVAGGSLLASLCSAVDHVGFVCEMSCNIITMLKFDPMLMLAVLHTFAHICGSKYFTLQQYTIAMALVKSLVMFLEKDAEKRTLSTNSTSFSPLVVENLSPIWSCSTSCPFSEGAVSMEDVALLLLENLQKHGQSESWPRDSLEAVNSLVPKPWFHEEGSEEVSGLRDAAEMSSTYDGNLCAFIDILSLVEILASFMSWDWTFDHIIGLICDYLDSHLMEGFTTAIFVLLGQLGRLGVGASGYDDPGVQKLRVWFATLVRQTTFMQLNLPAQFAIINAFFGLTPIKFDEIVDNKVESPAITSQSIPASFIRQWFFLLSSEQQSLFRLH